MPDTRSKEKEKAPGAPPPSKETLLANKEFELQELEKAMCDREARLKKLEFTLRARSDEIDNVRTKLDRDRDDFNKRMAACENKTLTRERDGENKGSTPQGETRPYERETREQRVRTPEVRMLEENQYLGPTATHVFREFSPPHYPSEATVIPPPKVSFREATESVPHFDGYNIPLARFTRACRRAREIIPPSAERNLTKLLINKLDRRAYYAVEDEPCETVTQLIDLLTGAFGSSKTLDQYRGELSTVYLKPLEHIIDYISRVKDLRTNILDAERRMKGYLDTNFVAEIDGLTARSFCEGLPLEYRLQLKPNSYRLYSEAFSEAKAIAKRLELDDQRYGSRHQDSRHAEQRRMTSVGASSSSFRPAPRSSHTYYRDSPGYRQRDSPLPSRNSYGNNNSNNDNNNNDFSPRNRYSNYNNYPSRNSHSSNNNYGSNRYPSRENYNDNRNYSPRNNTNNSIPRENYSNSNSRDDRTNASRASGDASRNATYKVCKYCKNPGHDIEECRKRQYNNSRRPEPGNLTGPSGSRDANRADNRNTRPVNAIATEENERSQS